MYKGKPWVDTGQSGVPFHSFSSLLAKGHFHICSLARTGQNSLRKGPRVGGVVAEDPLSCMRAVKGPWADPEVPWSAAPEDSHAFPMLFMLRTSMS